MDHWVSIYIVYSDHKLCHSLWGQHLQSHTIQGLNVQQQRGCRWHGECDRIQVSGCFHDVRKGCLILAGWSWKFGGWNIFGPRRGKSLANILTKCHKKAVNNWMKYDLEGRGGGVNIFRSSRMHESLKMADHWTIHIVWADSQNSITFITSWPI